VATSNSPDASERLAMEPKKERTEHNENGTKVERTTYDDPDTRTHSEEIKIEKTENEEAYYQDQQI
jgi:hypothetical protein